MVEYDRVVLSIDPGKECTGVALVSVPSIGTPWLIIGDTVRWEKKTDTMVSFLLRVYDTVRRVIALRAITCVSMENIKSRQAQVAEVHGQIRGVVRLAVALYAGPDTLVAEFNKEWRKLVGVEQARGKAGDARKAQKEASTAAYKREFRVDDVPDENVLEAALIGLAMSRVVVED